MRCLEVYYIGARYEEDVKRAGSVREPEHTSVSEAARKKRLSSISPSLVVANEVMLLTAEGH